MTFNPIKKVKYNIITTIDVNLKNLGKNTIIMLNIILYNMNKM